MENLISDDGIIIIGCGKMGGAILNGWIANGIPPDKIGVIEPEPSSWLKSLVARGLNLNENLPSKPLICLLAVKPQKIDVALMALEKFKNERLIVVSIVAGLKVVSLENKLGPNVAIIRVMPNTPVSIQKGLSVFCKNKDVSQEQTNLIQELFNKIGESIIIEDEDLMDAVTAISGSGPAYVFYFIESLFAAGKERGLSADLSMKLAKATVFGAGALAISSNEEPRVLRMNVTSPNGTTQAALNILMDADIGLLPLIKKTVFAAEERSKELDNLLP